MKSWWQSCWRSWCIWLLAEVSQVTFGTSLEQFFTYFWHGLYIGRLQVPSPRMLTGFYPNVAPYLLLPEGNAYQKPIRKSSFNLRRFMQQLVKSHKVASNTWELAAVCRGGFQTSARSPSDEQATQSSELVFAAASRNGKSYGQRHQTTYFFARPRSLLVKMIIRTKHIEPCFFTCFYL